jgi:nitrate/TMAO reductase-like tetraheme cytochrome c subunit
LCHRSNWLNQPQQPSPAARMMSTTRREPEARWRTVSHANPAMK